MSGLAERASLKQRLDRLSRHVLVWFVGLLLGVKKRPVALPHAPRILVVRLDERVGNVIMTTAIAGSLKKHFKDAHITFLGHRKNAALFANHPWVDRFVVFDKRALTAAHGPLRTPFALRKHGYDLAIDAANATDPSATQALLVRFCGAKHSVGYNYTGFGRLFTSTVSPNNLAPHEVDMRLALVAPVVQESEPSPTCIATPTTAVTQEVDALLAATPQFALVNIGARLKDKRLNAQTYAALATLACQQAPHVLLTYGPSERALAEEVAALEPRCKLAPPTGLVDLALLFARAQRVVSCDTGPMHLAVSVGTPTCAIFVSTDPLRYGYAHAPHAVVDARNRSQDAWLPQVAAWMRTGQQQQVGG